MPVLVFPLGRCFSYVDVECPGPINMCYISVIEHTFTFLIRLHHFCLQYVIVYSQKAERRMLDYGTICLLTAILSKYLITELLQKIANNLNESVRKESLVHLFNVEYLNY